MQEELFDSKTARRLLSVSEAPLSASTFAAACRRVGIGKIGGVYVLTRSQLNAVADELDTPHKTGPKVAVNREGW